MPSVCPPLPIYSQSRSLRSQEQYVSNAPGDPDDLTTLIFVRCTSSNLPGILSSAKTDQVLWRQTSIVRRTFLVTSRARSMDVLIDRALNDCADGALSNAKLIKVIGFPRIKIEPLIVERLKSKNANAVSTMMLKEKDGNDPADPDAVLCVLKKKNKLHFGVVLEDVFPGLLSPDPIYNKHTPAPAVCRAGFKMEELMARNLIAATHKTVVDIGAAPGGWSAALAMDPVTPRKVFAIDPAELDTISLRAAPENSIVHIQKKAEESVADIDTLPIDAIVCDANLPPQEALDRLILPFRDLCRPGALIILTCKCSRHGFLKKEVAEAERILNEWAGRESTVTVHLLANTLNERTIICEL